MEDEARDVEAEEGCLREETGLVGAIENLHKREKGLVLQLELTRKALKSLRGLLTMNGSVAPPAKRKSRVVRDQAASTRKRLATIRKRYTVEQRQAWARKGGKAKKRKGRK